MATNENLPAISIHHWSISSPRGGAILYTPPSPPPRLPAGTYGTLWPQRRKSTHTHLGTTFFSYYLFYNIVYLKKKIFLFRQVSNVRDVIFRFVAITRVLPIRNNIVLYYSTELWVYRYGYSTRRTLCIGRGDILTHAASHGVYIRWMDRNTREGRCIYAYIYIYIGT